MLKFILNSLVWWPLPTHLLNTGPTVSRKTIRELVDKTSQVVLGDQWQVQYAYFARSGFTDAARAEAQKLGAILVDLETLDNDLRTALLAIPA